MQYFSRFVELSKFSMKLNALKGIPLCVSSTWDQIQCSHHVLALRGRGLEGRERHRSVCQRCVLWDST
jgi:hypothetical protein